MSKTKISIPPAKWQITATTIKCDLVDDFVTIMVYKDWSTKCVWYARNKQKAVEDKNYKVDRKMKAKVDKCQGPECSYVTSYKDKLISEEFGEKK
jgi:major membrane immunogen (membrane-anchored lipoprotein)